LENGEFRAIKEAWIKDQYDYFLLPKKISFAFNKENNHERSRK